MQGVTWVSPGNLIGGEPGISAAVRRVVRERGMDALAAGTALCAAPLSIAVSESFLALALMARIAGIARHRAALHLPGVFWFWFGWAWLETLSWLHAQRTGGGASEIRHLLLLGALFLILPVLNRPEDMLTIWRGIFLTSSAGCAVVVLGFFSHLLRYRHELSIGGDPAFYLRDGGLLHHWMIYATVEVLVFGALLEFRASYPEERRWASPALGVHCLAIVLSLTRMLWLARLLLLGLHLVWRRSKQIWVLPAIPALIFLLAPGPLRHRVAQSFQPDYYSNAERVQMWHVGWKMIREQPVFGVGPGRIDQLYPRYLAQGEPVPAYHGHLHNNALQLAAQFGIPILIAAMLCLAVLLRDVLRACRRAYDRECLFLCRSSLLGIFGFLTVGMTDYTYGHSLGLILLSFAALSPLLVQDASRPAFRGSARFSNGPAT
ncbi:MAG: O-antigen ligase family protein [Acidobacteriia bacterium]|nr:O-antigen ligase family protein [Terriglobia bacterium]